MGDPVNLQDALAFAVTLDGAVIATAFGDPAVRLGEDGPVVVFTRDRPAGTQISLKLSESRDFAISFQGVHPTGHGYGGHGWVTVILEEFEHGRDLLPAFIEESYECALQRKRE